MKSSPFILVFLGGCHLFESGSIGTTCEDLSDCVSDSEATDSGSGVIIDPDGDGFDETADCNDMDGDIYPGAPEFCDGIDSDCDGGEETGLVSIGRRNYDTIQEAIDAAENGATIEICGGTRNENLTIDKTLHLRGFEDDETRVVASESGSTIRITSGDVEITNLTISGGTGSEWSLDQSSSDYAVGGGIRVQTGSLILASSLIEDNVAEWGAGVFGEENASVIEIRNSVIRSNTSSGRGGGVMTSANLILVDTTITENSAPYAAGLYSWNSELIMDDSHILSNQASFAYGGLIVQNGSLLCRSGASIASNDATSFGGGLTILNASISDCLIEDNEAPNGAGIHLESADSVELNNVIVRSNHAAQQAGGIYVYDTDLVMEDCTIEENTAPFGAGMLLDNDEGNTVITDGEFRTNTARGSGGGIYYLAGNLSVESVDFGLDDDANSPDDFLRSDVVSGDDPHEELGEDTSFVCQEILTIYTCNL